jgi:site-specific recombinase XerD
MNTSFNLELRPAKQDGTCPIYLRVTQNRKKKRISTNISVKSEHFNPKAKFGYWVRKNPNSKSINEELEKKINEAKDALKKVEGKKQKPTASNVIAAYKEKYSSQSFIHFYEEKLEQFKSTKSISYFKHMNSKLNNLKEFIGKNELNFQDINVTFLKKFEAYLMSNKRSNGALNKNSTTSNLRAIRTILYEGMNEDKFEGKNPFKKKGIISEFKTVKGKLSIADIKNLESLQLPINSGLWHTNNFFLFAFYAAGTRFSDIAQLKWKNIDGNRLSYIIEKIEDGHSIILIEKALLILEKYKKDNCGPEDFVFPILNKLSINASKEELFEKISSKNAKINKDLKKIQELSGINTLMTFHLSRHSFADILRTKEVSIYDISKLLGHSDIKVTQRYLKGFDNKTSDAALTKGLDF